MTTNIFEKAARLKLRFETARGDITVEDLFDLPLRATKAINLDDIAKGVFAKMTGEVASFVTDTKKDEVDELKLEIVKYVIAVKMGEIAEAKKRTEAKDYEKKLVDAIADKDADELKGKSKKELKKELKKVKA